MGHKVSFQRLSPYCALFFASLVANSSDAAPQENSSSSNSVYQVNSLTTESAPMAGDGIPDAAKDAEAEKKKAAAEKKKRKS